MAQDQDGQYNNNRSEKFLSSSWAVSSTECQTIWTPSALEVIGNKLREIAPALYMYQVLVVWRCKNLFLCKFWSTLMSKRFIYNKFPLFIFFAISTNDKIVLWDRNFESICRLYNTEMIEITYFSPSENIIYIYIYIYIYRYTYT